MKLEDLKIIITGGAQGMGRHFAMRIAEAGGSVCAGDVQEEGLNALKEEAASMPGKIFVRKLDVSNDDDIADFVGWAHGEMGGLNALVNNAGILRDGLLVKKDRETGEVKKLGRDQWDAVLAVNLTGATMMAQAVVAKMVETGEKGLVLNMSSIARHGNRGQSNYTAAKAALAANTKTWSMEWAKFGIRAGAIAPGMIETPMTRGMHQKARDALVKMIPVGRIGEPEDIWCAARFIIECDYFNGRTIDVDGGLTM